MDGGKVVLADGVERLRESCALALGEHPGEVVDVPGEGVQLRAMSEYQATAAGEWGQPPTAAEQVQHPRRNWRDLSIRVNSKRSLGGRSLCSPIATPTSLAPPRQWWGQNPNIVISLLLLGDVCRPGRAGDLAAPGVVLLAGADIGGFHIHGVVVEGGDRYIFDRPDDRCRT